MTNCLICNTYEKLHVDKYVCSDCVQKLLNLDRDKLSRLRAGAIEKKNQGLEIGLNMLFGKAR